MTVSEMEAARDALLAKLGIARETYGERSVEYYRQLDAVNELDRRIAAANTPAGGRVRQRIVPVGKYT